MQSRELVIPQKHANVIWWAAWLSLGAAWHAVYIQQPGFGIVPTCVLCTSLNYWRNPVRTSWSRTVDIGGVWGSLCYQNAIAYYMKHQQYQRVYFGCIAVSGACYVLGHFFMALNMPRASAYAHAGIHVVANIGNIVLQRGQMP